MGLQPGIIAIYAGSLSRPPILCPNLPPPHSEYDDIDAESQAASKALPHHGQHQRKQHQKQPVPPSPAILAMFKEAHSVHPKKQPSHGNRGSSAFRTRPRETVDAASTASHLFLKYFREDYNAILQKSPKVPGQMEGGHTWQEVIQAITRGVCRRLD